MARSVTEEVFTEASLRSACSLPGSSDRFLAKKGLLLGRRAGPRELEWQKGSIVRERLPGRDGLFWSTNGVLAG